MSDKIRYSVNKKTGAQNSFNAGSSFDKERTKSDEYRVFNDSRKASEYARKINKR